MPLGTTYQTPPTSSIWFPILQETFRYRKPAKECMCHKLLLILKGASRDFRRCSLVEVLWNIVIILPNLRLMTSIKLHDVLHRFQAGRGTGTAALDYKLLQYILAMREADLFEVFLDLPKAYDALDWDRLFVILA